VAAPKKRSPAPSDLENTELVQTRVPPRAKALLAERVARAHLSEAAYVRIMLLRHLGMMDDSPQED